MKWLLAIAALASTTGCAAINRNIEQNYADQAGQACIASGYTLDHPQHSECVVNTVALLKQREQQEAQAMLGLGVLGGAYASAASSGYVPVQQSQTMICPDGSYIYGTQCNLAPDGSYVAGTPRIAPNGSYVSGTPQITPNGSYVSGNGPVIICPDGSYVSGRQCQIAPDGSYVGTP